MDGLIIKVLTDDYAEETLKLFNSVFNLSKSMDFWIEKHYKNPLGKSLFIGAFYEDKLIAMNALGLEIYNTIGEGDCYQLASKTYCTRNGYLYNQSEAPSNNVKDPYRIG